MAKLKIGTKVRDNDGDEGVIVGKSKGYRDVKYDKFGGTCTFPKSYLTSIPANDNAPAAEETRTELCNTAYSVGQRVRFIRDNPNGGGAYGRSGEEFVVSGDGVEDHEGEQQVCISHPGHEFWPHAPISAITPVVAPATTSEWVPKVGERVVYSGKSTKYRDSYMIGALGTVRGTGPDMCIDVDWDDKVFGGYPTGGGKYVANLAPAPLPVAEQPAGESGEELPVGTWSPVAGKFGKTRDGRKVGPIENYSDGFFHAGNHGPDCTLLWTSEGKGVFNEDLVAEWVGPAATPVAVAEATTTPVLLKVGDRIRRTGHGTDYAPSGFETFVSKPGCFRDVEGNDTYLAPSLWELALEPPTPAPKIKVGDRVVFTEDYSGKAKAGDPGEVVGFWAANGDPMGGLEVKHSSGVRYVFAHRVALATTPPIGSTVTFTATGRLSAINENGHHQVTFPGLPSGQNSFALPAKFVTLAN